MDLNNINNINLPQILQVLGGGLMSFLVLYNLVTFHLTHFWSTVAFAMVVICRGAGVLGASSLGLTDVVGFFENDWVNAVLFDLGAILMVVDLILVDRGVKKEREAGTDKIFEELPLLGNPKTGEGTGGEEPPTPADDNKSGVI